jgi:hypothetical protein
MASVGDLELEGNDFVAGIQLSMANIEADPQRWILRI